VKKKWLSISAGVFVIAGLLYVVLVAVSSQVPASKKEDRVRLDFKGLGVAISTYAVKNGRYPESLQALTQRQPSGDDALIEEKSLIDPWGRPYHYDPDQRHEKTDRPLIWSDGPNADDPRSKISNWD
jgi:type II secretory pathway pseudopilin PulG